MSDDDKLLHAVEAFGIGNVDLSFCNGTVNSVRLTTRLDVVGSGSSQEHAVQDLVEKLRALAIRLLAATED